MHVTPLTHVHLYGPVTGILPAFIFIRDDNDGPRHLTCIEAGRGSIPTRFFSYREFQLHSHEVRSKRLSP